RARCLEGLDARDAALQRFLLRPRGRGVALDVGREGCRAVRELVRALLKNLSRGAGGVAEDHSAFGGDRVLSDLRRAERRGVQPAPVAITAPQDRRTLA